MERFLCIHGHFYQPPRESPWLEAIELQESAYPYHDWNERIADECYAANARSRILDGEGNITRIVNNYEQISFNFGPTLMSWLEEKRPEIYRAILEADKNSAERFSGHGNAMAQGYGHIILPLSNDRDRRTQVIWGIRDFEKRFGRKPEGMWCPEAAVNTPTLEALAEQGIKFTVLAPRQAARFRDKGQEGWTEVGENGGIDPSRAYLCKLPSGKEISLFFYDGPVSQAVAFERLLESGEKFASRLASAFDDSRGWDQLVHIATDGETYGHHHANGDMALAYALDHIQRENIAKLTNYGEYLEKHAPTHEAQIAENSSWSCDHGVERWKSNCGCSTGGRPEWNQNWRGPLREALDWLRDTLAPIWEKAAAELLKDPWAARDGYIDVILDRTPESRGRYYEAHAKKTLSEDEQVRVLKLMELQRQAMLMYTSCGWFFDELSGIETVQVIMYAGRVVQLARNVLGQNVEGGFEEKLAAAKSNIPDHPDGRAIYNAFVKPAIIDLQKVAGHYAIKSLFSPGPADDRVYSYDAELQDHHRRAAGRARMLLGRARLRSRITGNQEVLAFGVLHLGDHLLSGGTRAYQGDAEYDALVAKAIERFDRGDYTEVLRLLEGSFGSKLNLRTLFKDEQRAVLDTIFEGTLRELEAAQRQTYQNHGPLLRFLASISVKAPDALLATASTVLNGEVRRAMRPGRVDVPRAAAALQEAREQAVALDRVGIAFDFEHVLNHLAESIAKDPRNADTLVALNGVLGLAAEHHLPVRLWEPQNVYFDLAQSVLPERRSAGGGDETASRWLEEFARLGKALRVKVAEV